MYCIGIADAVAHTTRGAAAAAAGSRPANTD